jgi:chalcone isomerase-like protein
MSAVRRGLVLSCALLASHPATADVTEPRSGVAFAEKADGMTLLGVGLRTKTMLKVKVYAAGLYVSDAAIAGPLKGKAGPDLFKELVWGDFPKQMTLKLVRDLSAGQMQDAVREALAPQGADKARVDAFVSYFGDIKTGEEYVIRWAPGGTIETSSKGQAKPPIADKTFAAQVFAIWLGDKPIQDDLKADLASRAPQILR